MLKFGGLFERMGLQSFFIRKKGNFSEECKLVFQKFGLEGKVDISEEWCLPEHRFTLYRIIESDEGRNVPLPPLLVKKVARLINSYFRRRTKRVLGKLPTFYVAPGKTTTEIKTAQKSWAQYCELFWVVAEG
ncbi:MAG: hypothetical protein V1853_00645 [bacterium]